MCCILHRPKGASKIAESNLKAINRINDDGWGISYIKDGILKVVKSMDMDEATKQIRELEEQDIEFLYHARYATHGDKIVENCHPYNLCNGVMFHNGKIDVHCQNKKFSDTFYFSKKADKFLKKGKTLDWLIKKFEANIGESRLAFMNNDGTIEKFGEWHDVDGCQYSKLNWQYTTSSSSDSHWWDGYGGYTKYTNVGKSAKESARVLFGLHDEGAAMKRCVENAERDKMFYTYVVRELSDVEMIKLAVTYPKLCAEYLSRQFQSAKQQQSMLY